jgi:hypothetical protein
MDLNENLNIPDPKGKALPLSHQRGALESAAMFLQGGTAPSPDHESFEPRRIERVRREQRQLIVWARENKKELKQLPPLSTRGGEHQVHFSKKELLVIKSTLPNQNRGYGISFGSYCRGATPAEYLDRLMLQNELFNDSIRLKGIVENSGKPIIVSTQPFYNGVNPTVDEIDGYMKDAGFERLYKHTYYLRGKQALVFDVRPTNVKTDDDKIFIFDPVIQRADSDFANFLKEELGHSLFLDNED